MDYSHASQQPTLVNLPPTPLKRERSSDDNADSPAKKIKTLPEEPSVYSENVRKKLAATSRTGQACDRCKERKMKCDPDPVACQPCRQKQLRCYTTDRVTGQSRERGQTGRDEYEITYLRDQLAAYRRLYGALKESQVATPSTARHHSSVSVTSPPQVPSRPETQPQDASTSSPTSQYSIPSSKYTGWSVNSATEAHHTGPVDYTEVSLISFGSINTADFACDVMHEYPITELNRFNFSNNSVANTMAHKQLIQTLELPPREEVLNDIQNFFLVMWGFVPVVHKKTILKVVNRLFDDPLSVSLAEKLQVVMILAIMAHQNAIRNHSNSIEKLDRSFHYLHYALGFYTHLAGERSLAALQALTLILVQLRNFPKPGFSWLLANQLMVFAINLDYHRDPDKIVLPSEDCNPLAKEMRKRIFHSILAIAVTTGCRFGKPSPWHLSHWDVPLPTPMLDDEISVNGTVAPRSGECDYWPCLHLAKFMPLMIELYNHVLSVRPPASVYLKTVEALRTKVEAWRAEWDEYPRNTGSDADAHRHAHGLLFDSWAAEFLLNLHHPRVNTSTSPDVQHEHLNICHRAATRLLRNFHILSERYKACDFTWHSVVAYVCGFGVALQTYKDRAGVVSDQERQKIRNELAGWVSLTQTADQVLRTDKYLERTLRPLAKAVEDLYEQYTTNQQTRTTSVHQNSISNPTKSMKQELNTDISPFSRNMVPQSNSTYVQPSIAQQSPRFQPQNSYMLPHTTIPPMQYPAYSPSSSATTYANLPTSLAPLLNDTMANTYSHMQQPVTPISLSSDTAMSFHPQLYSSENVTMVWPHAGAPR